MKFFHSFLIWIVFPFITFAKAGKKDDGFISLFNGKDLTHWNTTGNWIPQKDGSLLIQPKPGQKGWQRYSDYLISKEKFGDFIFKLEYKYPVSYTHLTLPTTERV